MHAARRPRNDHRGVTRVLSARLPCETAMWVVTALFGDHMVKKTYRYVGYGGNWRGARVFWFLAVMHYFLLW